MAFRPFGKDYTLTLTNVEAKRTHTTATMIAMVYNTHTHTQRSFRLDVMMPLACLLARSIGVCFYYCYLFTSFHVRYYTRTSHAECIYRYTSLYSGNYLLRSHNSPFNWAVERAAVHIDCLLCVVFHSQSSSHTLCGTAEK